MLIAAFGTYTPFASWGFLMVRRIADVLFGSHHHVHCNTMAELAEGLKGRASETVVITADCPEPAMAEMVHRFAVPIVAFLDDPEDSTALAMQAMSFGVRDGMAFSSYRLSALSGALGTGRVLRFGRAAYDAPVRDVLARIQAHVSGTADPEKFAAIERAVATGDSPEPEATVTQELRRQYPDGRLPSEYLAELPADVSLAIHTWCAGFHPVLSGEPVQRIDLPPALLHFSPIGGTDGGHLDICGPGRCLMWGPYIYLPAGRWIAKLDIEVVENYAGCRLEIDVLNCPSRIAVVKARLPREGVFACEFPFEIERFDWRIEVRVLLQEGMIEGRMIIRNVRLERVGDRLPGPAEPAPSLAEPDTAALSA